MWEPVSGNGAIPVLGGDRDANQGLAADLRERIVLSPITVLEVLSHLTLKSNATILAEIQAIHNWVNPKRVGLLNRPNEAIARIGFQLEPKPCDFIDRIEKTINLFPVTDSAEDSFPLDLPR